VKVNFYATLRLIVGSKSVDYLLEEGQTIGQVLNEIIRRFPALQRELLDEQGQLYRHVHVFVNGRDVAFLENGLDKSLNDDDVVSLFPAVGGG